MSATTRRLRWPIQETRFCPDYGPVPKGKANIMRQGQTENLRVRSGPDGHGKNSRGQGQPGPLGTPWQQAAGSALDIGVRRSRRCLERVIVRCQQAPDAQHFAGPCSRWQMDVLDMVHGPAKQGAPGGAPPPGGGAGAGPPPGGGAPPGGGGPSLLAHGRDLAGLQGSVRHRVHPPRRRAVARRSLAWTPKRCASRR